MMSCFDIWWERDEKHLRSRTVREWAKAGWEASKAVYLGEIADLALENQRLRQKILSLESE